MVLLVGLAVLTVVSVIGGMAAALLAERFGSGWRLPFFGALLAFTLVPTMLHYDMTIAYASSYGAYAPDQPVGFYPGLRQFQFWVPVGAFCVWVAGMVVALRAPFLSVAAPPASLIPYHLALGWVSERPPGVVLDNVAVVWLAITDLAAAAGLVAYALLVWGVPGTSGKRKVTDKPEARKHSIGGPA